MGFSLAPYLQAFVAIAILIASALCSPPAFAAPSAIIVSIPNGTASGNAGPGYSPSSLTIVIGVNNTVIWENNDTSAHTVTPGNVPSAGSWSVGSGNLDPGQTYKFTFTVPGEYTYACAYHSFMYGSVIVKSTGSTTPEFSPGLLAFVLFAAMASAVVLAKSTRSSRLR